MATGIMAKLFGEPVVQAATQIGKAAGNVMDRIGFTKKLSEGERIEKFANLFGISEASTESARNMFMVELRTQKQPWVIRLLNGFVRPFGGIGALTTEFYAIWGANIGAWFGFTYIPVEITPPQHLVLAAIIAFYFGSRLKETLNGVSAKR
jgi:hypothetical protein